jgi:hypothetical protein
MGSRVAGSSLLVQLEAWQPERFFRLSNTPSLANIRGATAVGWPPTHATLRWQMLEPAADEPNAVTSSKRLCRASSSSQNGVFTFSIVGR